MAPAKIPCVGDPPVTEHREPEEQRAALARHVTLHTFSSGQGWEVAVPLIYDFSTCRWSRKLKQGKATSCWVMGLW